MLAIGESLMRFWSGNNIKLRCGIPVNDLLEFEQKYNVILPDDLKNYFTYVDGFDDTYGWVADDNLITFLPLAEVLPSSQKWTLDAPDADSYFVFADYSLSCHVYMIELHNNLLESNPVFIVRDSKPKQIASSFSDFVNGYLADDCGVLFPR